jgi:molybdenum cofactor synthesis domain-containing protein
MVFRPFDELISLARARELVLAAAQPLEASEGVGLAAAAGRVLATPVVADRDVPGFDRSAMDGYAMRAADVADATPAEPVRLALLEAVHAGHLPRGTLGAGSCIQVATGAPLPEGAEAVVKVEDTAREGDAVLVRVAVERGKHVVPRGEDMRAGDEVLSPGMVLTPARVGVLAALGLAQALVFRRPRVMVLPTGTELVPPGRPLEAGQVYDSNAPALVPLVQQAGGVAERTPVLGDEQGVLEKALCTAAGSSDIVVVTGGSSVGERDLLAPAMERLGSIEFHGVAVKPGKPVLCGRLDGALVLGLPGNPTSCLLTAWLFLRPALRQMARLPPDLRRCRTATLAAAVRAVQGRDQLMLVRLEGAGDALRATPCYRGSGAIMSMALADGVVALPAGAGAGTGEQVEVDLL